MVLIPLGRLRTSPILLLARGALLSHDQYPQPKETSMVVPNQEPKKPAKRKKSTKPDKSPQRSIPVPVPASTAVLNVINPDAAVIDVHSNMHMVCVPADRDAN